MLRFRMANFANWCLKLGVELSPGLRRDPEFLWAGVIFREALKGNVATTDATLRARIATDTTNKFAERHLVKLCLEDPEELRVFCLFKRCVLTSAKEMGVERARVAWFHRRARGALMRLNRAKQRLKARTEAQAEAQAVQALAALAALATEARAKAHASARAVQDHRTHGIYTLRIPRRKTPA